MEQNLNRQVAQLHEIFPHIDEVSIRDVLASTRTFDDAFSYISNHPDEFVWKGKKGSKPAEQEKKFNRTDRPARGPGFDHEKYNNGDKPPREEKDYERGRGRGGRGRGRGGYDRNSNTYTPDNTPKEEPKPISQAAQVWGNVKIDSQSKKAQNAPPVQTTPIEAPKPVQTTPIEAPKPVQQAPAPAPAPIPAPAPVAAPVPAPQPVQVTNPVVEKPKPKKQKAPVQQQTAPQAPPTPQVTVQTIIAQNPIPAPPQIQPIIPVQSDTPLNPANFQAFNPQKTNQIKDPTPEKIVQETSPSPAPAPQRAPRDDRQRNQNSQVVRLLLPEELKGVNPKLELFGLFGGPLPTPAPAPAPTPVQVPQQQQAPAPQAQVQQQPPQIPGQVSPQKDEDFQHQMAMYPFMMYPQMIPNPQGQPEGQMPPFAGFPGFPQNGMQPYPMPWGNWGYGGYPNQMPPFQGAPPSADGPPGFTH